MQGTCKRPLESPRCGVCEAQEDVLRPGRNGSDRQGHTQPSMTTPDVNDEATASKTMGWTSSGNDGTTRKLDRLFDAKPSDHHNPTTMISVDGNTSSKT